MLKPNKTHVVPFLAFAAMLTTPAFAHLTGDGHVHNGFAAGFGHPISGIDHILAMVAVGLWAAQRGGKFLWALPVTFVSVMLIGGALGMSGVSLPFVEPGIAASVLVLGLLVASAVKTPASVSVALVGLFALFHGHAHGTELPAGMTGAEYALGFAMATAALHGVGIAAAFGLAKAFRETRGRELALRIAGGAVTLGGVLMIAGVIG